MLTNPFTGQTLERLHASLQAHAGGRGGDASFDFADYDDVFRLAAV